MDRPLAPVLVVYRCRNGSSLVGVVCYRPGFWVASLDRCHRCSSSCPVVAYRAVGTICTLVVGSHYCRFGSCCCLTYSSVHSCCCCCCCCRSFWVSVRGSCCCRCSIEDLLCLGSFCAGLVRRRCEVADRAAAAVDLRSRHRFVVSAIETIDCGV